MRTSAEAQANGRPARCRLHGSVRLLPAVFSAALWFFAMAVPAAAQPDFQLVAVGNGVVSVACIAAGVNGTIDSVPVGDDTATNPPATPKVLAGPNGVCDTTAAGDDVQSIPVGQSEPNGRMIVSGRDVQNNDQDNGVCDNTIVFLPGSDDTLLIPAGQSTPQQVGVAPGPNATLDTGAANDDVISALICPGAGNTIESSTAGDDFIESVSLNCFFCVSNPNICIVPGANGVLETTLGGNDFTLPVILTGADGISDSAPAGDDEPQIVVGEGFQQSPGFPATTVCADSGANGIAESTLCGNGVIDTTSSGLDEQCDDGNLTNGDGCDDDVANGGNCTTTACGNGVVAGSELCDDGNTNDNDPCTATCTIAACGDASTCSAASCTTGPGGGPEECDDANLNETDGCTSICEQLICGDGQIDPGEQCDDGNASNKDACLNNCSSALCGDGIKCTSASCTSGPGGGPERCDPPDGTTCTAECGEIASPCLDGVVNGLCTAPVAKVGNTCLINSDCDSSSGSGDGVCNVIETCDDGNSSDNDGCPTNCQLASCGDGFVHETGGSEQCDDGNNLPGDGCDPSCQTECGNGLLDGSCSLGLPFGTSCSTNSDCDTAPAAGDGRCAGETCDVGCGIATTDGLCAAGISGTCAANADCDTAPASGDGLCLGSTCGAGCTVGLTGTGANTPACTAGTVGSGCSTNTDCETAPAAGDGVCNGPSCDPAGSVNLFCGTSAPICSDFCQTAGCGNALRECSEECDAGSANGLAGSGCDTDCTRTGIVGRTEFSKARECVAGWSLDDAPDPLTKKKQKCTDCSSTAKTGTCTAGNIGAACCKPSEAADCDSAFGAGDGICNACDADSAAGVCTFKLAACLNRIGVPDCDSREIVSFELRAMKVTNQQQALATSRITEAVRGLSPGQCTEGLTGSACTDNQDCDTSLGAADGACSAVILGRCRRGAKNTTCTIGNDFECDGTFGGNNGKCDLGTGVRFLPSISQPADGGDQQSTCTSSIDIPVVRGTSLRLKSFVRRIAGRSDRDNLKLVCE